MNMACKLKQPPPMDSLSARLISAQEISSSKMVEQTPTVDKLWDNEVYGRDCADEGGRSLAFCQNMKISSRNPPCWSSQGIGTLSYEKWSKEWCCGISSTATPATQPSDCVVDEEVAMAKCLNMEKWRAILLELLKRGEELLNRNPSCQRHYNSAEQLETANRLKV